MDPDKYQQAWQADAAQTRVIVDADLLSKEVQRSHGTFQSTIFLRDVREVGVAVLLIPFWFYMGIKMALPWMWYLTVPAIIWGAGFILVDRRRHPQRPSETGEPLLYYVKESLTQVEHQIWLMHNVFWWYLLPYSISIMAFFLQVAWQTSGVWWEFVGFGGFMGLVLLVIYGSTYRLNQRAVREQLEPRRQDLLKLIASLEDETSSEDSDDIIDLVSSLADPVLDRSLTVNWNLVLPSWRQVPVIILATLAGAWCGLRYPIPGLGPEIFQTGIGAIIALEIALATTCLRRRKKPDRSLPANRGSETSASGVDLDNSANQNPKSALSAPARMSIGLILFLAIMGGLFLWLDMVVNSGDSLLGAVDSPLEPDFADVSAFGDSDISRVDTWLKQQVDVANYPSLSVAVVRDGEIVYQRAFGFENIKTRKKATLQTQYHVASVTKAFTASLAVILHDRGVVDLDQPVVKYLPTDVSISTTPELGAKITLRQLASHTSGLPKGVPGRLQSVEGWYQLEPKRLYDHLANVKLEFDPGTNEEYSNLGFGLLGHALECAADKPFDRLLQELVCDPLQLKRTAIQADDKLRPATGYDRSGLRLETKHSFRERLAPSGGLVASVEDLAKFLAAQMKPGVLSGEMLEQLHKESILSSGSASGNALGWSVRSRESVGRILKKNGGRRNCSAWIGFAPEHGVGVAVVTNCGGPDVDQIGYWLLERSVPHKLVTKDGYAKVAPYTGVRWENDQPIVRLQDRWSPLVSIDGIPIDRIMEFAHKEFGDRAHKRFAEDLVEVLSKMGHEPKWEVTLGLESEDGKVEQLQVLMTEDNRKLIWE